MKGIQKARADSSDAGLFLFPELYDFDLIPSHES